MSEFLNSAVVALREAAKSGVAAESAVVKGTKAVVFMAMVELGRKAIAGELEAKEAAAKHFTAVAKQLVFDKTPIFRDSLPLWIQHVKGKADKPGPDGRRVGVNAYIKACKNMKLVGPIANVKTFSNKLVKEILASCIEDCRNLAREFPSEDARYDAFTLFWEVNVRAETYATLSARLAPPKKEGVEAIKAMVDRISKIDDVASLQMILDAAEAAIATARENATRLAAVVGAPAVEIDDSDMEESNVVTLRAA